MGRFEDTRRGLRSGLCRETPQGAESMPYEAPAGCPAPLARDTLADALPERGHGR